MSSVNEDLLDDPIVPHYEVGEDYTELLRFYGIDYDVVGYRLEVGNRAGTSGWILHLSVVISQLSDLLWTLLPFFMKEHVSFRIAKDKDIASDLLNGNLGIEQLGKVVSVYPQNGEDGYRMAKKLLHLTNRFKGPAIPTDICLGGILYCRYGHANPGNFARKGGPAKVGTGTIAQSNQFSESGYSIPFKLPEGIPWPFGDLKNAVPPKPKLILKNIYKPLFLLKADTKGCVYKGIFMKGLFKMRNCVIKQGNKNAASDNNGRDIYDRLVWQMELHNELAGTIPLPSIIDLFKEGDDGYLVMEFVEGISLYDRIKQINFSFKSWDQLAQKERSELLNYVIEIMSIVENLHRKKYVHRDIAPGNFIINKSGNIVLIDMELGYSLEKKMPSPPFEYGTKGFMSPEQLETLVPTVQEDIYGLGALMAIIFTGLYPTRFNIKERTALEENLFFFINDNVISNLIAACLSHNPEDRPGLATIRSIIEKYRSENESGFMHAERSLSSMSLDIPSLKGIVTRAIDGLIKSPIVVSEEMWYSKLLKQSYAGLHEQKEYYRDCGLHTGISGVLYLLSRAKSAGFSIESCKRAYDKGWNFIDNEYLSAIHEKDAGLYQGSAGIGISLAEAIKSGLLSDGEKIRRQIRRCFEVPVIELDLANGISGKGIAILQCEPYLDAKVVEKLLGQIINMLLDAQQKDGSWVRSLGSNEKKGIKSMNFGLGVPGITWFLLHYLSKYPAPKIIESVERALRWMLKTTNSLNDLFEPLAFKRILNGPESGDERKGVLMTFIKAYEVLHNDSYRSMTEKALSKYPANIIKTNFTQESGLAGLGEIYLEANRVFKSEEWVQRSNWIANVYLHTFFKRRDGSGYWVMEENNDPTADFMVGNSGIIHFLIRNIYPEKIGYRLLS